MPALPTEQLVAPPAGASGDTPQRKLDLPLVPLIRSDCVPATGFFCPCEHHFFGLRDGSYVTYFDPGLDTAAKPPPNPPCLCEHHAT